MIALLMLLRHWQDVSKGADLDLTYVLLVFLLLVTEQLFILAACGLN